MMMLSSFGFLGRRRTINAHETMESSLGLISAYLGFEDHLSLKLTCRAFYYWFVASEVWFGLKMGVADEKMEHYEDFQFEEAEPKQITKRDKNIRIHSLKKQSENKVGKRDSSNIKQKAKPMIHTNELLFRNTEIGFKRVLKTNNSQRPHLAPALPAPEDLYALDEPDDYIIKSNEPWSVNMKKAQKLTALIKKFNEFHHRMQSHLKSPCKEMAMLYARLKESEDKIKEYGRRTASEPLAAILQSTEAAGQSLLIDEQLNKVCKLFWIHHPLFLAHAQEIDPLLELCREQATKLQKLQTLSQASSIGLLEAISALDELVGSYEGFTAKYGALGRQLCPGFICIYSGAVENMEGCAINLQENRGFQIRAVGWDHLVGHSFFFETLFQILHSLCNRLIRLAGVHCADDLVLAVTLTRLKNLKSVSQALANVSKYFGKLRKQVEEKKVKTKSVLIKEFLESYSMRSEEMLYQVKNPMKLEKWVAELKEQIAGLKARMQSQ